MAYTKVALLVIALCCMGSGVLGARDLLQAPSGGQGNCSAVGATVISGCGTFQNLANQTFLIGAPDQILLEAIVNATQKFGPECCAAFQNFNKISPPCGCQPGIADSAGFPANGIITLQRAAALGCQNSTTKVRNPGIPVCGFAPSPLFQPITTDRRKMVK